MDRREFIAGLTAAGVLSLFDSRYLAAREEVAAQKTPTGTLERRALGKTGEKVSVIGFGGVIIKEATQEDTNRWVAEAFERGVNYYDVAPAYGRAQDLLGPALKPYRDRCFLASKTGKRDAESARTELENSLKVLQTDRLDLYQLHAVRRPEEVERVFAPGGAMEVLLKAKEEGKVRFLGFSAHGEEAAQALLDRKVFDTAMFPFNFHVWWNGNDFGPSVHKRLQADGLGKLAIKPMALGKLTEEARRNPNRPHATWYLPLEEIDQIGLGMRFAANLPVDSMLPPGEWELFKMSLDLAQADGGLTPLNEAETETLKKIASTVEPMFKKAAAQA